MNFDFTFYDLCFDPILVLDQDEYVIYMNPAFEATYNFSQKKSLRFKTKLSSLMNFDEKSLSDLQNGVFYHLGFTTAKDQIGVAQVGVTETNGVKILFIKDLAFEEHLQSKYKTVLNSLRGNNQKLIQILDEENHNILISNELQKFLRFENSFCIVKTDDHFKFLSSTSDGFERRFGQVDLFPWVKVFTQGQADKTNQLLLQLKALPSLNKIDGSSEFEFTTTLGSSLWNVKVLKLHNQEQVLYYFILREIQTNIASDSLTQLSLGADAGAIYSVLKTHGARIRSDFKSVDSKDVAQLLRNYFWQTLFVSVDDGPLSEFTRTHIESPEFGKELKILGQKSLDYGLSSVESLTTALPQSNNFMGLLEYLFKKLSFKQPEFDQKFLKKLDMDELAMIFGCVFYFNSATKVALKKLELSKSKKGLELKFNFKFPRDPKSIYEFLKRAHLKSFDIEGDCLTVLL